MIVESTLGMYFPPNYFNWVFTHSFDCPCDSYWECPTGEDGGSMMGLS